MAQAEQPRGFLRRFDEGDGVGQNFAGGKIFYTPATGANVLTGQVLAKYESVGGPQGDLGLPTSNEGDGGLAAESKVVTFANPARECDTVASSMRCPWSSTMHSAWYCQDQSSPAKVGVACI